MANIIQVYITGTTVANDGLALTLEFVARRAGKKIHWALSKRLKTGAVVALSPAGDNFNSKCIIAVVASRQLSRLNVEFPQKPSIKAFVGDASQLEIDPQQEYVMVESLDCYWEAYRHTLQALQRLRFER